MEQVSGRIFKLIEEDEAKRDAAGTFLNYYLPTTLKLLENYASFEEAGVSGENLSQAKAKIEKTMDSIVAGFEHQLDELYRTDAMDIDSDIRVMRPCCAGTAAGAADFGASSGSGDPNSESCSAIAPAPPIPYVYRNKSPALSERGSDTYVCAAITAPSCGRGRCAPGSRRGR